MKIYELDRSFYNKIRMYPTYNKFIFTEKGKQPVIVVDNSVGDFFVEEFSNKTKGAASGSLVLGFHCIHLHKFPAFLKHGVFGKTKTFQHHKLDFGALIHSNFGLFVLRGVWQWAVAARSAHDCQPQVV